MLGPAGLLGLVAAFGLWSGVPSMISLGPRLYLHLFRIYVRMVVVVYAGMCAGALDVCLVS